MACFPIYSNNISDPSSGFFTSFSPNRSQQIAVATNRVAQGVFLQPNPLPNQGQIFNQPCPSMAIFLPNANVQQPIGFNVPQRMIILNNPLPNQSQAFNQAYQSPSMPMTLPNTNVPQSIGFNVPQRMIIPNNQLPNQGQVFNQGYQNSSMPTFLSNPNAPQSIGQRKIITSSPSPYQEEVVGLSMLMEDAQPNEVRVPPSGMSLHQEQGIDYPNTLLSMLKEFSIADKQFPYDGDIGQESISLGNQTSEMNFSEYKLFPEKAGDSAQNLSKLMRGAINPRLLESMILGLNIRNRNFLSHWKKLYSDYNLNFNWIHISTMLNLLVQYLDEKKIMNSETEDALNLLLQQLYFMLLSKCSTIQPRELSNISAKLVKLKLKKSLIFLEIAKISIDRLKGFNHIDLAVLAWSFARVEIDDPNLLDKLFKELEHCITKQINYLNYQDLVNIIDAFSRYGLINQSLLDNLLGQIVLIIEDFGMREFETIFKALLNLSQNYTFSKTDLKGIASRIKELDPDFDIDEFLLKFFFKDLKTKVFSY